MVGIEVVKDKASKAPDAEMLARVYEKTKDYGILMGKGGRFGNVFRF